MFFVIGELIKSTRLQVGRVIKEKDDGLALNQLEAEAQVIDLNAGQSMKEERRIKFHWSQRVELPAQRAGHPSLHSREKPF